MLVRFLFIVITSLSILLSFTHYEYSKEVRDHTKTKGVNSELSLQVEALSSNLLMCKTSNEVFDSVVLDRGKNESGVDSVVGSITKELMLTGDDEIGSNENVESVENVEGGGGRVVDVIHPDIDGLLHEAWGALYGSDKNP